MNKILPLIFLLVLVGCAAPGNVKDKANSIMGDSSCHALFINNDFASYQHCTHQFSPKCVFALAKDSSNNQSCAFARKWELVDNLCVLNCGATITQIEALALSRCEEAKSKMNVDPSSPCKVFAHNNDIIWDSYKKDDTNFQ